MHVGDNITIMRGSELDTEGVVREISPDIKDGMVQVRIDEGPGISEVPIPQTIVASFRDGNVVIL